MYISMKFHEIVFSYLLWNEKAIFFIPQYTILFLSSLFSLPSSLSFSYCSSSSFFFSFYCLISSFSTSNPMESKRFSNDKRHHHQPSPQFNPCGWVMLHLNAIKCLPPKVIQTYAILSLLMINLTNTPNFIYCVIMDYHIHHQSNKNYSCYHGCWFWHWLWLCAL